MKRYHRITLSVFALSVSVGIYAKNTLPQDNTITVTASTKQSEYSAASQNVSAIRLNSYRLEEANITSTQTLNKVIPGFNYGNSDSSLNPVTAIRGFTSIGNWYNPAVTLYVDGVPQFPIGFSQPLDNITSVEVLKGSQATLYGTSAEGGIINIITEQPDNNYKGYLQGGYASRGGYRGKVNVSGPLVEGILYGSISGMRNVEHGRMFNPGTGHGNLGGEDNNIGSVKLRLAPENQPWQLLASYTGQCMDGTPGLQLNPFNDPYSTTSRTQQGYDPATHRCIQNQSLSGQYTTDHWLISLTSAWLQTKVDKSGYNIRFPGRWLGDMQELRVSTLGKNNIIDGAFGLYRQNTRAREGWINIPGSDYYAATSIQSIATYGDLTWHTTSQLDFGAGLRFSQETAKTQYPQNVSTKPRGFEAGEITFYDESKGNHLLGQVSAGYQFTDASRIYARIAQGYKPIGYNFRPNRATLSSAPKAFNPETSLTYEIGNKYHSDTINLQSAIFYNQVSNTQMFYDSNSESDQRLVTAGGSRALGFELTGDYSFMPGWRVGANINLINDKFTGDSKNREYANKRVPIVPKISGGLYLSGNINTAIGVFSPYIGFNYTGAYSFDEKEYFQQKGYSITDIRLSWQPTDRITLSAYIDNLFDTRYLTYANYNSRYPAYSYGYANFGRTAGVDLKIDLF